MIATVERRLEGALDRTPLADVVEPQRAVRFAEYLAVGASGAVLDVAITASMIGLTHYVLANAVGFFVANSWNFGLNRRFTFSAEGSIARQYPAYLVWHLATFAVRVAVLAVLVEVAGAPVVVASVAGIGAATVANFTGSERIFGTSTASPEDLRVSAGRSINSIAHALYTERVRDTIVRTGLYAPLYGGYQRVLGWLYAEDVHVVDVGDSATARLHMESDAEVLSVLHTLRKEGDMIEDFAASIEPDDVVWDVGANLGVFSLLAADRAVDGHVVAFEPFEPTAERLEENVDLSDPPAPVDIATVALWDEPGRTALGLDRDEIGTQTPTVDPRPGQDEVSVVQAVGDELVDEGIPAPDVLKVDVEGAERPVLDGMERTLQDCRLVFVEDHSALWGGDDAGAELQERLEGHGFDVDVERQGGQTYYRGHS